MATTAQIQANRRNALRSTGPRTEEGKEVSKLNAIKHGLAASTSVVLPHEDAGRYHQMRGALIETWQPANAQELLLVDQICQAWWATERSARFQNGFFSNQLRTMKARNGASRHPHAEHARPLRQRQRLRRVGAGEDDQAHAGQEQAERAAGGAVAVGRPHRHAHAAADQGDDLEGADVHVRAPRM